MTKWQHYVAWFFLTVAIALVLGGLADFFDGPTAHGMSRVRHMSEAVGVVVESTPSPVASPLPSAAPSPSPVASLGPINAALLPVIFEPVDGYATAAESAKIVSAGRKALQVVRSPCFADFIRHRALIQTNGRTPDQVADHLQHLVGTVPVVMYYRSRRLTSAVAYRQPPDLTINLNRAYFSTDMSDCDWAATLGHESFGHSLGGYDHDYKWSPARSYSVPYTIGGADQAQGGSAFDACCH